MMNRVVLVANFLKKGSLAGIKKVMTGASGIPNVIEINGEDYIRRPK